MSIEFSEIPIERTYISLEQGDSRLLDAIALYEGGFVVPEDPMSLRERMDVINNVLIHDFRDQDHRRRMLVGEHDARIVSAVQYDPNHSMAGHGLIERMVVLPEYRGHGVAAFMIGKIACLAEQEGNSALRLRAIGESLERHYARMGFRRDEITPALSSEPFMSAPVSALVKLADKVPV